MKICSHKAINNAMKVIIMLSFFGVILPLILGKLNFFSPSHAAAPASPEKTPEHTSKAPAGMTGPVSYADAVSRAAPAVVSIKTSKEIPIEMHPLLQDPFFRYFFGEPGNMQGNIQPYSNNPDRQGMEIPKEVQQGLGSGVIVNDKGYILTNYHVIKEADKVVITLPDSRTADATVIGTDPDSDLAVLQIKLDKLPVIPRGASKNLRPGDVVLAIGNPFGLDKTVTQGIISATDRAGTDIGILENLIQTDAAINPGNSGGALIDAYGHLVGINTAIFSRTGGYQGIGFAVPIDQAMSVMDQLINGGTIKRGYLGVNMRGLTKDIRDQINFKEGLGVYVQAIVRGSPAQKAGLLPGDVIIKINDVEVKDEGNAVHLVAGLTAGQNYPVEIYRKGDYMTFMVLLGERKQKEKVEKDVINKEKRTEENQQ